MNDNQSLVPSIKSGMSRIIQSSQSAPLLLGWMSYYTEGLAEDMGIDLNAAREIVSHMFGDQPVGGEGEGDNEGGHHPCEPPQTVEELLEEARDAAIIYSNGHTQEMLDCIDGDLVNELDSRQLYRVVVSMYKWATRLPILERRRHG